MLKNRSWNFTVLLTISVFTILVFFNIGFISKTGKTKYKAMCSGCNVVIIDIDVLRSDAIDCVQARERTPNLCRLADESVVFSENSSMSDFTKTSYASFITSTYPSTNGVWNEVSVLNPEVPTLTKLLKGKGYITNYYGQISGVMILEGFDEKLNFGCSVCDNFDPKKVLANGAEPFFGYVYIDDLHFPYILRNGQKLQNYQNAPEGIPVTFDENIDRLKDFIFKNTEKVFTEEFIKNHQQIFNGQEKNKDNIFGYFVQGINLDLNGYLKDSALTVKEAYFGGHNWNDTDLAKYLKSSYFLVLRAVDRDIGDFLNVLENDPYKDSTIVIVRSDHGEEFLEHGKLTHGNSLYRELIHTPLLIRVPGLKHKVVNGLVMDIDIMPTIFDLIGLDLPTSPAGISLVPIMIDPKLKVRDYQIAQKGYDNYIATFRKENHKIIMKQGTPTELYDLSKDPGEKINLIGPGLATARALFQEYTSVIDPLPKYGLKTPPLPTWVDEKKKQRLKDEGYF